MSFPRHFVFAEKIVTLHSLAVVAQLVERWLPKPKVAGSRPVYRSNARKNCGFSEKFASLHSRTGQGRSSAGLERFSHIEEVIGSNPIVPTQSGRLDRVGRFFHRRIIGGD